MASDISEKLAGEGSPLTLADVETNGFLKRKQRSRENCSLETRMPMLPFSPYKLAAKFFPLS